MRLRWLPLLVLVCIAFGGLAVFATDPLLYAVEKDQSVSLFHKNPVLLRQLASNSTTDLIPLMQDLIDDQEPLVFDIRLRDIDAAEEDLAEYTFRRGSLKVTVENLDLNDAEIQAFLSGIQDQEDILSALAANTSAFESLRKIAERNRDDLDVQVSVASQAALLKESVRTLDSRYSSDHRDVMNISTKLGLDTRLYEKTLQEVQNLVAEIQAEELTTANPASLQESRITLLVEPAEAGYRDTVQFFGLVTPSGEVRQVHLLLDSSGFMTAQTDLVGNYHTSYTVERISAGEHIISAGVSNRTPAERMLTVITSGTVTTLSAEPARAAGTGAALNGSVLANHPVRNAPVRILADGTPAMDLMTGEDGTFRAFLQLPPGSHTLRAEFSGEGYPLFPSASDDVTIEVPPRPFTLPGTSPDTPLILYGAVILVLLGAGSAAAWYIRRGRRTPPAEPEKEPAEAVLIRNELEEMISDAMKELPAAGSEREAALETAINTLLERYAAALGEHGLSEAARQAYLTLAGRIAASIRLPAYRSLTPREMSATCRAETYGPMFALFVGIYERIRYAGSESDQDKRGFFNRFVGIYERIRSGSRDGGEIRPVENEEGPS